MYDLLKMEHPQSNRIRTHLSEKFNEEGAMSPGTENEAEGLGDLEQQYLSNRNKFEAEV